MDNAKGAKSEAIRRGCDEYGIKKIFRPVARPHFGGHIERLHGRPLTATQFGSSAAAAGALQKALIGEDRAGA